jgi:hypothetical protein
VLQKSAVLGALFFRRFFINLRSVIGCSCCLGGHCLWRSRRWGGDQLRHPSEVLGDSRQRELILGATRTAQPKAAEPQDALEMREPRLDALAIVPRALERFCAGMRPSNVSRAFVGARLIPSIPIQ